MKDYKNNNPTFRDTISVYERTDPADADTVENVPLKQLADNTNALKKMIDEGGGGGSLASEEDVMAMAEDLMLEGGGGIFPETATDEDIDDLIDHLDEL